MRRLVLALALLSCGRHCLVDETGRLRDTDPADPQREVPVALGEKLFTRIKDEKDRALIRAFLAEQESQGSSPAR